MPESKSEAKKRARRLGFKQSQVVKAPDTNHYFIAPHGVTSTAGKKAYAGCRDEGGSKGTCAAISHKVDKNK
jgi:hypothetical protein